MQNSPLLGAALGAAASVVALVAMIAYYRMRKQMGSADLSEILVSFVTYAVFGGIVGAVVGWIDWPIAASLGGGVVIAVVVLQLTKLLQRPERPNA